MFGKRPKSTNFFKYNDSNSLKEYFEIDFNQGHMNDDFPALNIFYEY